MPLTSNITATAPPQPMPRAVQDSTIVPSPTNTDPLPPPAFMVDPIFDPAEFTALSSGIGLGMPATPASPRQPPPAASPAPFSPRPKVAQAAASSPKLAPPTAAITPTTGSPSLFAHQMNQQITRPSTRMLKPWLTRVLSHTENITTAGQTLTAWLKRQLQPLPLRAAAPRTEPAPRRGAINVASRLARHNLPLRLGGHILDLGLAILVFNGVLYGILLQQTGNTLKSSFAAMLAIGWAANLLFSYGFLVMLYGIGWIFHLRSPGQLLWYKISKILTKS